MLVHAPHPSQHRPALQHRPASQHDPASQLAPAPPSAGPAVSSAAPIRVLLVDDHPAVRLGAQKLIDDQPDMRVVAEARGAEEALGDLPRIDVAIVDYRLGDDGRDGLWLTLALKRLRPAPRVLIYSAFADGMLAVAALVAGADGLLGKHELGQELCRAIRRLARGRQHLPAINSTVAQALRERLQPSDQAVFGMLLHGIAPETIAARLGIAEQELETRRSLMLRSLRPARSLSLPTGAPLDYERAKRRGDGWAA